MTAHYDIDTRRWEVTNGSIIVRGPEREACEERLTELERRLKEAEAERFRDILDLEEEQ